MDINCRGTEPKLCEAGRKEEMEHMKRHGVSEVVDEIECYDNLCTTLSLKVGRQDEKGRCVVHGWCALGTISSEPKRYSRPCHPRRG